MSMDAELIIRFITQQVSAVMAKKLYEKNLKTWRKVERMMSGESAKNGTRGGGRASNKNKD